MSESKEEVVSIDSRSSIDPPDDPLDPDVSECEDDDSEETTDPAARGVPVSPCVNGDILCFHSPPESNLPHLDRPRVRFRSRVRISAGIGRRRRLSEGLSSNASSISGSPSSSISAPLRTQYTGSNNGWGPLGTRVSLLASQNAVPIPPRRGTHKSIRDGKGNHYQNGNAHKKTTRRSNSWVVSDGEPDERTHLMTSAQKRRANANGRVQDWYRDDSERERRWREQLVDEAFGKWPGRLLNRHWWWWQLEPIVCCFCICSDLDEAE